MFICNSFVFYDSVHIQYGVICTVRDVASSSSLELDNKDVLQWDKTSSPQRNLSMKEDETFNTSPI